MAHIGLPDLDTTQCSTSGWGCGSTPSNTGWRGRMGPALEPSLLPMERLRRHILVDDFSCVERAWKPEWLDG